MKRLIPLLLLALASCQPVSEPAKKVVSPQRLTLSVASEITTLDPRISFLMPTIHVLRSLFEGLTRLGPDGTPVLALAEHYEISDDGKVYTFHLRKSQWSNGDPVTARDFAYSWRGSLALSKPSLPKAAFFPIKNVDALTQGRCSLDDVGIRVLDDATLQIELEHPYEALLQLLAYPTFAPIPQKVDEMDSGWVKRNGNLFICNGPFSVKSRAEGNILHLAKNPHYWDAANIRLEEILIYVVPDIGTQDAMFQKGEIDFIGEPLVELPTDILARLESTQELGALPSTGVFWCVINTRHPLLKHPKAREALATAINRRELVEHILPTGSRAATSFLPLQMTQMTHPRFADGDPQKAQTLFQQALQETKISLSDLPTLTLLYLPKEIVEKSIQVICDQWKKTLGLDINLECVELKMLLPRMKSGAFDLGACTWFSWIEDPLYTMHNYRSKDMCYNYTGWSDPVYTQLLNQYQTASGKHERLSFLRQAEEVMMRDLPVIPIYFRVMNFAQKSTLRGLVITPYNEFDLRWAYFQD